MKIKHYKVVQDGCVLVRATRVTIDGRSEWNVQYVAPWIKVMKAARLLDSQGEPDTETFVTVGQKRVTY